MCNFNVANFLENAPIGLVLYSKFLGEAVEFNRVINKELPKSKGSTRVIECLKYDDTGSLTDEKIFFDAYGRIMMSFYGNVITHFEADLMPDEHNEWDDTGIGALISESPMCIDLVLMDKFESDSVTEFPWIVGDTAMWSFDDEWESVRFHKFDFSNVRFANGKETKELVEVMHERGLDFKDGSPIKNGKDAEPECRNADKELFFGALSDLCENWKGTIPDADFYEVLFRFNTEVAIPEMKKAFGWNSEIIKDKD